MPSPKHPCAHTGCKRMVARKEALHYSHHRIYTAEHKARISMALKGQIKTPETRRRISLARTGSGDKERVCPTCQNVFVVSKPSSKVRFCSCKCGYKNRQGDKAKCYRHDMPTIVCRVCGKIVRLPAISMAGKRFTCSYQCKNIWQLTHQKNKGTDIERAMEAALLAHSIKFIPQFALCNVTVSDFYLPDSNAAIFCDGDYWHSSLKRQTRDARQRNILKSNGFQVFIFKGSEILADVNKCIAQIKHQ